MKISNQNIVKKSIFKTVLALFALMLFTNWSKNPVKCLNGSWIQDVSADLEKWSSASGTYAEEPTEENCNSYKSAINAYLTALNQVKDCVPGSSLSDFDGSLDEAKQELSEIDCTGN